jgi:hypothetical protein
MTIHNSYLCPLPIGVYMISWEGILIVEQEFRKRPFMPDTFNQMNCARNGWAGCCLNVPQKLGFESI